MKRIVWTLLSVMTMVWMKDGVLGDYNYLSSQVQMVQNAARMASGGQGGMMMPGMGMMNGGMPGGMPMMPGMQGNFGGMPPYQNMQSFPQNGGGFMNNQFGYPGGGYPGMQPRYGF
jgi:hypothetical protein